MPVPDDLPNQLTFNDEDVAHVLRDPVTYAQAAEVLTQMRVGREGEIPSADGLNASADGLAMDRAPFWIEVLRLKKCLPTFVVALRARGILPFDTSAPTEDTDDYATMFNPERLRDFLARMDSFRCTIRVHGDVKGSGILVGPSSVLTAWHVIAKDNPKPVQEAVSKIDVVLADGRKIAVALLSASSPCGEVEWPPTGGRAPENDSEVEDTHDIALLRLKTPAGIHLTYAPLAAPPYAFKSPAAVVLVSCPQGEWRGVEFAKLQRLRNLTARWGYDVKGNRGGSSGGGCFDNQFALAGIHQGRAQGLGRLIPLIRFHGQVKEAIANDELPPMLWSLDGTPQSNVIVGRDYFFIGYQSAMRGAPRARGLWIRRVNMVNDQSGLPFSFQILESLVARSPNTRLIRISFDSIVHDLPNEIARRAIDAGLAVQPPNPQAGAGVDQTEPEAMVADRARRVAQLLDERAHEQGIRLWVFFDHPSVVFGDEPRWALTAFVDQAMRMENLRIALAGFELVQMPGAQYEFPGDAIGEGPPGLMIEYLTNIKSEDLHSVIDTATEDLKRPISKEFAEEWVEEALEGLNSVNGKYDSNLRTIVASRLQKRLQQLCKKGPRP
ncbi:trypsin-like peptidase domain-containing protein [Pseudomonas sp. HS6]|uniref:trypsin-like peptidase domain-containing protein n=1 Tax=Pseudomonas sp. HS6 TaxID=2850559 RepID=UPI0020199904|nr:trypsin-like peptidase domain-containing protein [Pseudomonas sp. HS6]UQS16293.1 trypsin-like peptidase domain-containing protein [Pseudomonas sp. HS6]